MTSFTLQDAIDLATFAHRHQYDKAGEPYIKHPLRVLENVKAQGARSFVQIAAVLHDVTEDTPFTPEMLLAFGVPEASVEIVKLVDRGQSKFEYAVLKERQEQLHFSWKKDFTDPELSRMMSDFAIHTFGSDYATADDFYYWKIKKNPGAVQVKKADIGDNTQPWRLDYLPAAKQAYLVEKYAKALDSLS